MKREHRFFNLQREISFPKWLGVRFRFQVHSVLKTLFRISCWSVVAWFVWNRVLSSFFNAGSVGLLLALGMGSFLHVMSIILQDPES